MGARVIQGDCRDVLPTLEAGSVRCCVTSPPYWGLRDYGTATWEGGDGGCDHWHETSHQQQGATSARAGRSNVEAQRNENFRNVCGKCGARRIDSQLGLEATPEEYVSRLVEVFREVRRVLADDGTLWLNLGDSYANTGNAGQDFSASSVGYGGKGRGHLGGQPVKAMPPGLKPKDLVGIPWRVAFALQADGWWLRRDIIWSKPNPMPESVTDRPTSAHEYLFLLSKSQTYYYDAEAIAEPVSQTPGAIARVKNFDIAKQVKRGLLQSLESSTLGQRDEAGRNRRSVWSIATEPFPGAHFAVMPQALVEPCILAGSAVGDTVLDPFAGSGTVGVVAARHGRGFDGIELSGDYAGMSKRRIHGPLFAQGAP